MELAAGEDPVVVSGCFVLILGGVGQAVTEVVVTGRGVDRGARQRDDLNLITALSQFLLGGVGLNADDVREHIASLQKGLTGILGGDNVSGIITGVVPAFADGDHVFELFSLVVVHDLGGLAVIFQNAEGVGQGIIGAVGSNRLLACDGGHAGVSGLDSGEHLIQLVVGRRIVGVDGEIVRRVAQLVHDVLTGNQAVVVGAFLDGADQRHKVADPAGFHLVAVVVDDVGDLAHIIRPVSNVTGGDIGGHIGHHVHEEVQRLVGSKHHLGGGGHRAIGNRQQFGLHVDLFQRQLVDRVLHFVKTFALGNVQIHENDVVGVPFHINSRFGAGRLAGTRLGRTVRAGIGGGGRVAVAAAGGKAQRHHARCHQRTDDSFFHNSLHSFL